MTTRPKSSRSERSGFTLVELMVVITVIGLLVGMLVAAVIPVMRTARQAAMQFEMKQIEQSIENFRNDYGFYPPTWNAITNNPDGTARSDAEAATALLRYINRIAPNNREGAGTPGSRPVDAWWMAVGMNISAARGEDLVFWLSGLSKNLQFPLTNTGSIVPAQMPDAYPSSNQDARNDFERQALYDFNGAQLILNGTVAGYDQAAGSESPWLYVDSANYGVLGAYHVLDMRDGTPPEGIPVYENPNTFQLFCGGIDKMRGDAGGDDDDDFLENPRRWGVLVGTGSGIDALDPASLIDRNPDGDSADSQGVAQSLATSDNICNFCEGPLDLLINGSRETLSTQ